MKNKITLLNGIALMLFLQSFVYSQEKRIDSASQSRTPFLHVGDKVPDKYYELGNDKNKKISLSDYKGKLVILDLWGVYCGSCIEHMPEVVQLQKQFEGKVQFIMVTKSKASDVKKLAIRSENVRNNDLPFITGEQDLAQLFDYTYVPTHVWIDGNGIIRYITSDENTTEKNITEFLVGKQLDFREKKTIKIGFNDDPLLVQMYPYFGNNFYIYSYLAPRDDSNYTMGGFTNSGLNLEGKHKIENGNNYSFKDLFKIAYGYNILKNPLSDSRIILNFKDTSDYSNPGKKYVYEIIVNQNITEANVRSYIRSQLDISFNVKSSLQQRLVPCLVLRKLSNGFTPYSSKKDTDQFEKLSEKGIKATLPWGKFFSYINFREINPPYQIFDETGIDITRIIDLRISIDFNNIPKMNESLSKYGLFITKEERKLDCIVVEEN
jgi:thiol-disulfide isomerase/thioredoxin